MDREKLEKLRKRLSSTAPLIGGLKRRGAVKDLEKDGSADAVELLLEAAENAGRAGPPGAIVEALGRMAVGPEESAREVLFRLVIEKDHRRAREIVLSRGLAPKGTVERALFYYVTGQWEKYEELDFDHALLIQGY